MLLHFLQKLDDDLGRGPDEYLPPPALLGVGNGLEAIRQYGHANHLFRFDATSKTIGRKGRKQEEKREQPGE